MDNIKAAIIGVICAGLPSITLLTPFILWCMINH